MMWGQKRRRRSEKSRNLDLLWNKMKLTLLHPKFSDPTPNCRFTLIGLFVYLFVFVFFLFLLLSYSQFGRKFVPSSAHSIYWDKLFNLKTLNSIFVNWNDTNCQRAKCRPNRLRRRRWRRRRQWQLQRHKKQRCNRMVNFVNACRRTFLMVPHCNNILFVHALRFFCSHLTTIYTNNFFLLQIEKKIRYLISTVVVVREKCE